MPAVISKFLEDRLQQLDKLQNPKGVIAKGLVCGAIVAFVTKVSYPYIKKQFDINTSDDSSLTKELAHYNNNNNNLSNKISKNPNNEEEQIDETLEKAEKILAQNQEKKKVTPPGLNKEFLLQLKRLIEIMIPAFLSKEVALLSVHTVCLITRTFLSFYVAAMEGAIVKYIVRKDFRNFAIMLLKWFGIAIPATFINSMLRYLENRLALAFRTRLVEHSYKMYFKNQTYFRVSNLDGRIENADHRLTDDISVFASSVAHLYSHLTKPCFDLALIGLAMARSSHKMKANIVSGPLLGIVVISITAHIMRIVSPKFGQLVSEEANRYGYLRHIHSRIITNAEEIACYGGDKVEFLQLKEAYGRLVRQMNNIFSQKLWFVMLEQFFMKYVWSGMGMVMVSLPILTSDQDNHLSGEEGVSNRSEYLTTARNLLLSGSDAIERLMSSYKEVVELAGYTYRVAGMLEVFDDVSNGIYSRTSLAEAVNSAGVIEYKNGQPVARGKIIYSENQNDMALRLVNVPVVTPNCDIVVPNLTISVERGMHLLITGPNGCGKSSLFRIISGLWPIYNGTLYLPKPEEGKPSMFYIPQRPYMSIGSLRDQVIYPDTREDMRRKNITEAQLRDIMRLVELEHIVLRDSFDEIRDWKDILSGGEKQRMAMARLFYHKPQYALLDECTSAVSIDVESSIYEIAKNMGITLLTITHRPSLWKFHTHKLVFDGQGGWIFEALTENDLSYNKMGLQN